MRPPSIFREMAVPAALALKEHVMPLENHFIPLVKNGMPHPLMEDMMEADWLLIRL